MINLGPYSGKDCPAVHFRPTILDRILEGVALLILIVNWGSIYWLYTTKPTEVSSHLLAIGGVATLTLIIVGACAYAPTRLINFPVRVNERNIGIQYLLAIRLVRAMNILLGLTFLSNTFVESYAVSTVFFSVSFVLLALLLVAYFIMAFKYK